MKLKIDLSELPTAIVPPLIVPILTLRVEDEEVLTSSTIVPGARSLPPLVQAQASLAVRLKHRRYQLPNHSTHCR